MALNAICLLHRECRLDHSCPGLLGGLVQVAVQVYDQIEMKKPLPMLTPWIIADLHSGDE